VAKKKTGSVIIKIILILFIILSLSLGVIAGYKLLTGKSSDSHSKTEETVKRNYVVIDETVSLSDVSEAAVNSASSHDVKMNSAWTFSDGKAYSKDAFVENPSSNINSVYFDIKVNGYAESIFTSPVLPVGSHIENITLDKALKAGTYNCTLTYTLLSKDGKDSVGTLQMALKIIVQS
jgi:hypothetical protein